MANAKTPGTCGRCHGSIAVGDSYLWSNAQHKRYHHKADDGSCLVGLRAPVKRDPDQTEAQPDLPMVAAPSDLGRVLAAAVQQHLHLTPAVSEQTIARMVDEALAARAPQTLKIIRPDLTEIRMDGAHYLMPRLLRLIGAGIHVYLWGPAGTGKTTAALQACEALGLGGEIDTLDPSTPKSSIVGYRTPTGEPVHTATTRCYGEGHGLIADEIDNGPAHVQTCFNSLLANGHMPAAWGLIKRHERFAFIGTGNTPGRPTPQFPDRRPMSAAFADRLYFLHWPLDAAIECRAAGLPIPTPPRRLETTCSSAAWVQWVQTVRAYAADNVPTLMVTPRASLIGMQALALGETPREIADGLVFRGADKPLVEKVLHACPLPDGN